MDGGIEQPFAPTLGALAVTRILLDVGDHTGIENALTIVGRLNDHQLKAGGFKSFRRTSPPTERENG